MNARVDNVAEVIEFCPSGALKYMRKETIE
ncbi:(4Fe-4S)-binding protein [Bacillus sp. JCM 19041]